MNRSKPHVFILPEDDANRQLATGFTLGLLSPTRQIRVLGPAGGWRPLLDRFAADHVREMQCFSGRLMVLLIDFDKRADRLSTAKGRVAEVANHLEPRVFVLGVWSKPEELKKKLERSYEDIGLTLAEECRTNTDRTWNHDLLRHNADELKRLRQQVNPILFP